MDPELDLGVVPGCFLCVHDLHRCLGCGKSLPHGVVGCAECIAEA